MKKSFGGPPLFSRPQSCDQVAHPRNLRLLDISDKWGEHERVILLLYYRYGFEKTLAGDFNKISARRQLPDV